MVILHIAAIKNEYTAGVSVAVPQHIVAQSVTEEVAFINIQKEWIDTIERQYEYKSNFRLEQLPKPFCNPDLVVFHNTYYLEFVKIARRLRKKKIPYIIIPHGTLTKIAQQKKWLKKVVANWICFNHFFEKASAIQFLSNNEMYLSKYQEKGFVGGNGVIVPKTKVSVKQSNKVRMVYIGRIEMYIKGLDLLIEAVSKNHELFAKNNIHLDLYGPDCEGGYTKIQTLIKKHKVEKYVSLHNAVVGKEKEEILINTNIFIQTSRTEGLPMGILETLSYGVPCIITRDTGISEMINKHNAGWVAATNVDGIATAMKKAVEEKDTWETKSKNARELIVDNYAWEKVAFDTIKEYKKIIKEA